MSTKRRAALSDPGSEAYRVALKMVKMILSKGSECASMKVKKGRVNLDSALPYHDVDFLRSEFGYEIVSQPQGMVVPSPFLSGYAKCVNRALEEQKSWKGEEVVYLNGDLRQLVVRGFGGNKVVRFYDDPSMHGMFFEEDAFVGRTVTSKVERMKENAVQLWDQVVAGDGSVFSKRGVASSITGDTVFVDPMRIRCSLQAVAAEVVRRRASRAKGWLPFDTDVLRAARGELYGGRVTYYVDLERAKIVFFEQRGGSAVMEYRLADYFSFLSREPFVCDGHGFVLEFQGSPTGRLDWVLSKVAASEVAGVVVEKVPLWSKSFEKPGLLVTLRVRGAIFSGREERVVLRDDPELFSKAVSSLVGGSSLVTVRAARRARAMFRDQVMLPSGAVVLPKAADGLVEEFLSRAVYRRAVFAKAAMAIEEAAAKQSLECTLAMRESMAKAVCSLMWSSGCSMVNALRAPYEDLRVAALDDTWDVSVVEETPRLWLSSCWHGVVAAMSGESFRDPAYWSTGLDRNVWEAAGAALAGGMVKAAVTRFFSKESVVESVRVNVMGKDRELVADKVIVLTGAEDRADVDRKVERPVRVVRPELSPSVPGVNPVESMKEEFDREFPGLSMVDVDARPYLVAVADRSVCPSAPLMKVPLVDPVMPLTRYLSTGFGVGVSGPRPRSVAEVVSAFTSRVGGAPSYQWEIDLKRALDVEFDRFAEVFLSPGWQETVELRVREGYMYPTSKDIRRSVAKMSPSNVRRVFAEDFRPEGILMTVLRAMVKREPKDRQDVGVAFDHKPNQTIMYQDSKVTNAYFSSALGKFHDCLDDVLRDGFMVNPRVDKAVVEENWNSVNALCVPAEGERKVILDVDISQCDKSQNVANIVRYMYLLCRFGFGDFTAVWSLMLELKRASDPSLSVLIEFVGQVISGYFNTISANSCIVAWASANALDTPARDIRRGCVSGDDVVLTVVTAKRLDLASVSEKYARQFNFDAKATFSEDVLYWCGRLGVVVEGYTYFVKDLGRIRSSFFKSQGTSYNVEEAWEAFLDETKAYDYEELVVGVAEAYAHRRGLDFVPIGTARAVAAMRRDSSIFFGRFEEERVLE